MRVFFEVCECSVTRDCWMCADSVVSHDLYVVIDCLLYGSNSNLALSRKSDSVS